MAPLIEFHAQSDWIKPNNYVGTPTHHNLTVPLKTISTKDKIILLIHKDAQLLAHENMVELDAHLGDGWRPKAVQLVYL